MTAFSRRKAIQTAGAAALAAPFAVPPVWGSPGRPAQPDPLLALEAQRAEAENAVGRAHEVHIAALKKARAGLPELPVRPTFNLADLDHSTPDGAPIDQSELTSLVVELFAERQDPQEIAARQRESKRKEARFLLPGTDELSPDWHIFIERLCETDRKAREQYDRAVEQHDQAKEAIHERPEIQQLDEERGDVDDQVSNIEHQIIATRATTPEGLAVKWRFAEGLLSEDENELENRVVRSIYADAEYHLARSASSVFA